MEILLIGLEGVRNAGAAHIFAVAGALSIRTLSAQVLNLSAHGRNENAKQNEKFVGNHI